MPRKPRTFLAGVSCHVIQRGNNRAACFFKLQDYLFYLDCLHDASRRYRVSIHAYVLMTNHVHLLLTPDTADGVSKVMQSVGRRYVQYVNFKYRRSGTLWEGRHKSCLVEAERYFLNCMCYIELNPVRANMVDDPGKYPWSSYRGNAMTGRDRFVSPHEVYFSLGKDLNKRLKAYRELIEARQSEKIIETIRAAIQFSTPLGSDSFRRQIERTLGHSVGNARRGRPALKSGNLKFSKRE